MENICQSCGMEMAQTGDFGTNPDGSPNGDYCMYCFKDGSFTRDCTMEQQIETNLQYLSEFNKEKGTNFSEQQAREEMLQYFPTLKRWKCTCTEACASGYNPDCTCTSSECHCTVKSR